MTDLPGLLAAMADAAGIEAALTVAEARGGTQTYFPPEPKRDHWLSKAVGHDKATAICAAITAGRGATEFVPMGPTSSQAERHRRIRDLLISGCPCTRVARTVGCDLSTIKRHRRRLRDEGALGQMHP